MTQVQLTWLIPMCGWLAFVTILFIRDTPKAEAITREFDRQDVARRGR